MSSNNLTFRFIACLSILTILNMIFLGFSWHKKDQEYACSVDNVIDGVARYVRGNGVYSLEHGLVDQCKKSKPSETAKETLLSALKNMLEICHSSRKDAFNSWKKSISSPIITLFTTWSASSDVGKAIIHNMTLTNWISFKPKIEVVVFTNDTDAEAISKSFGVHTYPILHHGGGEAPVLRTMFATVQKHFKSSLLYGYVNSDILFTDHFIDTLEQVLHDRLSSSKPLLLVGKRVNVDNITATEASSYAGIEHIAKSRGIVFGANAEDYFITNFAYPWELTADVVVGRVAYDNWLVGHTICKLGVDVIDLSETVLAVHQTTSNGGNFEGFKHKDAHFNEGLFKQLNIHPVYETGFTICAPEFTYFNLCGDVHVSKRDTFWDKCKCPEQEKEPSITDNVSKSG